jgi:creatinine amidohydrolase/Fe(II)-dependent formamide hydrolase-like protein
MSLDAQPWRAGLGLLAERARSLPEVLRRFGTAETPRLELPSIRRFVATGVGSSAAHAKFLAHVLEDLLDVPARYVPMSSLASLPARAGEDALVVFSQGLSPNARALLGASRSWRQRILVTAARQQRGTELDAKSRLLAEVRSSGGSVWSMPGEDEYGTLLRVVGPMAGYLAAWRLAEAIVRSRGGGRSLPSLDVDRLCERVRLASDGLVASTQPSLDGGLAFVALGSYGELVSNLQYKILEGLLLPMPPVWDLLHFAHGPFQQAFDRSTTFLALVHAADRLEHRLLQRLGNMLAPDRHRLVVLEAALEGPLAIFEHEAMLNAFVLQWMAERKIDNANWPGRGLDLPLYDVDDWVEGTLHGLSGFAVETSRDETRQTMQRPLERRLEHLTWPEVEALVTRGCRTAVLPLGSTEQHGPHLPFATDSWIGDALAERLCARVGDAIRLPTLTVGCSSEHLGFPGTIALRPSTLRALLLDVVDSLRRHRFERLFVFSAHGGNCAPLADALAEIRAAAAPLEVVAFTDLDRLSDLWHRESSGQGISAEASGHHAGEFETSILLAIRAEAVRRGRLERGFVEPTSDPQSLFHPSLRAHAPSGTVGDPTVADARRGERYLDAWVDLLLEAYSGEKRG